MSKVDRDDYDEELRSLQIAMVRFQQWAMKQGHKTVIVFEGRDGAGKDGTIFRLIHPLANRNTRVIALPKPSDREASEWWFQRYVRFLPGSGELVVFNRSWYNRAGVEVVMHFSTREQQEDFLRDAPTFEQMLADSGVCIVKFWLDISKKEQGERLDARRKDPIKALKVSAMDDVAQKKWDEYSKARNTMLMRTHTAYAPWTVVHTDHKKDARIQVLRHVLNALAPADVREHVAAPDPKVLYDFEAAALKDGRLEP